MPKNKKSVKLQTPKRLMKKAKNSKVTKELKTFTQKFPKLSLRTKSLFIFGFLFLSISLVWNLNQTIQLAFFTPKVVPLKSVAPLPTKLIISKIQLDLPIEETAIQNGVWQVANNISHLTTSARPGEKGPIILYGHNTLDRLGPIRWLKTNEIIQLETQDGKTHDYTIVQTLVTSPYKMDIFTHNIDETLIIYTCDGFADLQRFILIAKPLKNS